MHVVVPLRVEAVPTGRTRSDQLRIVEVAFGDEGQWPTQMSREAARFDSQLFEKVGRGVVDEGVDRVETQRVDMKLLEPAERVVDDVAPHMVAAGAVEVDAATPRVRALRQVGAVAVEVVPRRSQVVVDHIEYHSEAAGVAGVDQGLQAVGTSVGLVHGVPEDAVVSPVVDTVETVDGHHFHEVDPEFHEVVELVDGRGEGSFGREGSDVKFINRGPGELAAVPLRVRPRVPVDGVQL